MLFRTMLFVSRIVSSRIETPESGVGPDPPNAAAESIRESIRDSLPALLS
jgi:hypothetical protein